MIIRTVEFVISIAGLEQELPSSLPQVAFSGRSNVGKSSLINTLLGRTRKKIARVSAQPGKTRTLNYYQVNDEFFLVDLPGFGYAKVPGPVRESWRVLVEGYLSGDGGPVGVVHLVDSRYEPKESDRKMVEFLATLGLPTLIVLTKTDKLNKRARDVSARRAEEVLELAEDQVLQFSVKTGAGKEELLEALDGLLGAADNTSSPLAQLDADPLAAVVGDSTVEESGEIGTETTETRETVEVGEARRGPEVREGDEQDLNEPDPQSSRTDAESGST